MSVMSQPTKYNPWTRRKFLKGTTATLMAPFLSGWAAQGLSGCAQLDRVIVGDGADESRRVMILGGGISGLVAARELKKANIRFRVFEGSERLGGRVFSLPQFNEAQQTAELGAEWFSEDDDFLIGLCKDLKLDLDSIAWGVRAPRFLGVEKEIDFLSWQRDLTNFRKQILDFKIHKTDQYLDQMTVADLFATQSGSLSTAAKDYLRLLDRMGDDPGGEADLNKKKFRIVGGAQNLALALQDKVAGIIPNYVIVKNHRLTEIRESGKKLEMIFETPQGEFSIQARTVICTLPFSVLRSVKGIENLGFSEHKLKIIRELKYGSSGKVVASFADRFWNKNQGTWLDNKGSQWLWDSTSEGKIPLPVRRGILTSQVGGYEGTQLGVDSLQNLQNAVAKINSQNLSARKMETWQIMNWSLNPWSLGSTAFLGKGQVTQFAGSLASSERDGRFVFAGEHTAYENLGTLNGAVESGLRAALEVTRFRTELL